MCSLHPGVTQLQTSAEVGRNGKRTIAYLFTEQESSTTNKADHVALVVSHHTLYRGPVLVAGTPEECRSVLLRARAGYFGPCHLEVNTGKLGEINTTLFPNPNVQIDDGAHQCY